jgi:Protein of unknown function (DUF3043)
MARKDINEELAAEARAAGKGKATPKRRDQEAAHQRALVLDPKASSKDRREKVRVQRAKEQQALLTGDERNMPVEHRGPERRFIRDFVDARRGLGEYLMPASILFVIISLFFNGNPNVSGWIILAFYVLVFVTLGETFWAMRSLRNLMAAKFPGKPMPRGWRIYTAGRMLNLRRLRVPRPIVKRGEFPV